MSTITAVGVFRNHEIKVPVINPGNWFGKVFLIVIEDSFDPKYFAVEADHLEAAVNTFVESGMAPSSVLIDVDGPEKDDYAFKYTADDTETREHLCDVVGCITENVEFAVTLGNKVVYASDPAYKHLQEPCISDDGTYYDDDHVFVYGDEKKGWTCRYYADNLPEAGICPVIYREMLFSDVDLVEEN